jgi:serine/threonine-protein kinase RsbW
MSEVPMASCEFDASELLLRLDVEVEATLDAVHALIDDIMKTVTELGCAAEREDDIRLAIEEALTNAVVHGCCGDPSKKVQCCVACDYNRGMLIVVRDPGPGFDPASVPSPIVGKNIYAEHGRGIFLINQMVDEVHFEQGGTEIHMRVK